MGDNEDIDDDLLQQSETRQTTEELLRRTLDDALEDGQVRENPGREVAGYAVVELFLRTDGETRLIVQEACGCDGPWAETARFDTTQDEDDNEVICERVEPCGTHMRIIEENLAGDDLQAYDLCATGLPIGGSNTGGGGGGGGSPGKTIITKADVAVAAVTETPILFAVDIPPGSRRVSIRNTGSNPARVKEAGAGGGATRGQELSPGQTMSIGTSGGALAPLDGFSTLGTTFGFFFERD